MTETEIKTEIKKETNGASAKNGHDSELEKRIVQQVEYYFGDFNLPRDKFLQEQLKDNEEGWVGIDVMLKFQRLNKISDNGEAILIALNKVKEKLIEVDLENKKLRRNPEIPLPEKEDDEARSAKTVYVKGFEKEGTSLDDLLDYFKGNYENVIHVCRRTWRDPKTNQRNFKGSVFVTFKNKESAEKFMAIETVKSENGEDLVCKWQADYFKEKQEEFNAKKAQKNKDKKSKTDVQEKQAEKEEEIEALPKGAVLFMDGFKDTTSREDIKEVLGEDIDCDEAIAFVDFERGKTSGYIRFKEENAAKDLAEKLSEKHKEDKLKVKEAEIEFKLLEGDEENEYLEKAAADIKQRKNNFKNRGHKRKFGGRGGGRGGKRSRN